jgi:hypothetical protein
MKLDRVLTVAKYRDAPRLGIAELNGVPHIYESEFDERTEEYRDTYARMRLHCSSPHLRSTTNGEREPTTC